MSTQGAPAIRFRYASDQSLLIHFGDTISLNTHHRILRFLRWFDDHPLPEVCNLHPAYTSVLVVFDPLRATHHQLQHVLSNAAAELDHLPLPEPRTVEIPVHYGGHEGPDLAGVAALHSLTPERVIELHSSATYTVYFLGFVPGFAYLGGLPDALATPRLAAPRTHVPAGSVGIAGSQTGVYPFITPGGWRLIGRTDAKMFETSRPEMSLLRTGDLVRFLPA